MDEKIKLIKQIGTDDSELIVKAVEAYEKNMQEYLVAKERTDIVAQTDNTNVINLDKIWAKKYFYNMMRLRIEGMIETIKNSSNGSIINAPEDFCKKVIFNEYNVDMTKNEDEIDIAEYIRQLDGMDLINNNITYIASEINEETLFKEKWIKLGIEVLREKNISKRNEKVYDIVYDYLKNGIVANNYCNFKNNRCVAQRNNAFYPHSKRDGCCFKTFGDCKHLGENGTCDVECLPCRLFTCPYLSKMGIGYYTYEIVLLEAFYSRRQKIHSVMDFYTSKKNILHRINFFNK